MLCQINLRLKMLYDMMPQSACMGDVGTDHGFLPVYCVQTGKCSAAIASDLRQGPLETARKNIALYGCEQQISTLLCSGLEGYPPNACDVIVIAGMGGFTVCDILSVWLERNAGETPLFLLQPNTAGHELRKFLWQRGFLITEERAVRDGTHVYVGMKGYFAEKYEAFTETECYTGKIMNVRLSQEDVLYFQTLLGKYKTVLRGLSGKQCLDEESLRKQTLYTKLTREIENILQGAYRNEKNSSSDH